MKSIFFVFGTFFFLNTVFAQENSEPYIKGYKEYKEYFYFDSINKLCVSELACLDSMYEFFVTFRVDTNASITDFKIVEIPISKLPPLVKSYIEKIFKVSNNYWMPQVENGNKVVSKEIIYRIDLAKNRSIKDYTNEWERFFVYFLEIAPHDEIINKLDNAKNRKLLAIRY
jgi:hypothetical protein